jgi:hypothetical protein
MSGISKWSGIFDGPATTVTSDYAIRKPNNPYLGIKGTTPRPHCCGSSRFPACADCPATHTQRASRGSPAPRPDSWYIARRIACDSYPASEAMFATVEDCLENLEMYV